MAEIPAAAVTAATRAIVATAHDFGADGLVAIDYAKAARAAVGAAAPYFRHQVTQAAIDNVQHLAEAAQAKVAEHAHDTGYLQGVSDGTAAERERMRTELAADQTSDHAPIESMYGTVCRTCVCWQDAPVAEGGETEFGIAIPAAWPCRVVQILDGEPS
jgi:enamine deaminase RidA (YjgF/YER057c/UK114 family)